MTKVPCTKAAFGFLLIREPDQPHESQLEPLVVPAGVSAWDYPEGGLVPLSVGWSCEWSLLIEPVRRDSKPQLLLHTMDKWE